MHCAPYGVQLGLGQASGHLEAHGILRQHARLAIQADVIAVGFHRQAVRLDGLRIGSLRAPALLRLYLLRKLGAKIDVFGLVAGCVRVGDIGRHQLLPGTQQIHVSFEISSNGFKHDSCAKAVRLPRCKPLIPEGRISSQCRNSDDSVRSLTVGQAILLGRKRLACRFGWVYASRPR